MAQFPSSSGASGVWSLKEQRNAVMGSNWTNMASPLTVDYLVLAGGGGTGGDGGSGGGAGGMRCTVTNSGDGALPESSLSLLSATSYSVTVGAGGAGGPSSATNGSNSIFSTITSTGGGKGGGRVAAENRGWQHQAGLVPVRLTGERCVVHPAPCVFQPQIAAGAGAVGAGGDIGAGQLGQPVHQPLAGLRAGDLAAVQQHIGAGTAREDIVADKQPAECAVCVTR